jgi:O-antigen ligase
VAMRWPYIFPLGLYCIVVPFDQALAIPGAGSLTRYLGIASALAVAVYAIRRRCVHRPPATLYLFLAFFGWLLIGMFRNVDTDNGPKTVQAMALTILIYGIMATAPIAERQFRTVCAATVAGGVVAALYGMFLFYQHPELLAKADSRVTVLVMGNMLDANAYAGALLAPFSLAFISLLHARTPRTLLGWGAALVILFAAIVASLSREALLACIVVVGVVVWFSRRRVLGIVVAVPAFAALLLSPSITARIDDAFKTGGAGRTSIWAVEWNAFLQHPLIGWGTGNSIEAYDRTFLRVFQSYNVGWGRQPHNTMLFLAVELGIVGVVLFFAAWFAAFRPLAMVRRGDPLYGMRVALTAALCAMLVVGSFVDVSAAKHMWLVLILAAQFRTVVLTRPRPVETPLVYEPPPVSIQRARLAVQRVVGDGSPT